MSDSFSHIKTEALNKRKAELVEEFEAANRQLGHELNETAKVRIKRQIEDLETEIQDLDRSIENLQGQGMSSRRVSAPSAHGQYRVLVDEYHGEKLFGSRHRQLLKRSGFDCVTFKEAFGSEQLQEFDVLVIWFTRYFNEKSPQFSGEELSAIREYIDQGGNAFLIGLGWVWTNYGKLPMEQYPLNWITDGHGIFFTEAMISKVAGVGYKESPITFSSAFMREHPVTRGVQVVGCPEAAPGSLFIEPPAMELIWGSNETADSDGVKNPIVLAATDAGRGRIVCLQHAGYVTHMAYDNFVLLKNIFEWLVSR